MDQQEHAIISSSSPDVLPPNKMPHKSHWKNISLLIGFLTLLIFFGIASYYLSFHQRNTTKIPINALTISHSPTPEIIKPVEIETFDELGIQFNLKTNQQNQTYHALRIQNQVFIGPSPTSPSSQAIYVLNKDTSQTFADAVRTTLGIHNDNCYLKTSGLTTHLLNFPKNFQIGILAYKGPDGKDAYFSSGIGLVPPETATNCMPNFMPLDDGKYFLYDPQYPEKFFFVNIGQSPVYGDAEETKLWADTLRIINHNQYKAPQTFSPSK